MSHVSVPHHTFRLAPGRHAPLYDTEWLLTTGNGGFAMGTALGANRRKYHTLLVASAHPPVERLALLNALDVEVITDPDTPSEKRAWLAAHVWLRGGIESANLAHLVRFEKEPDTCRWVYAVHGIDITKELRLAHQRNACAVRFSLRGNTRTLRLRLHPMVTIRDFHATQPDLDSARYQVRTGEKSFTVTADSRTLELVTDTGRAIAKPSIRAGVLYDRESERHQDDHEDLYSPGYFEIDIPARTPDAAFTIAAALAPDAADPLLFDHREKKTHLDRITTNALARNPALRGYEPLIHAADDFLVQRDVNGQPLTTVIAGYPWFADWGRDTMISMVGLMLGSARYEDALGCLKTFAAHVSKGMIPNRFDDYGGEPEYNTVDAPLWFIHAACEYLRASNDRASFDSLLLPACLDIIEHYQKGTRYNIKADPADGLIFSGDDTTQLTWMDAKRNGVVFTPRHGKAVEINALWHHALRCVASAIQSTDPARAAALTRAAEVVGESFRKAFSGGPAGGLHDCLRPDASGKLVPSGELRPNQIFAVSLDHSPLTPEQQRGVVKCVRDHLLTPLGLRTLVPGDPKYCPRFTGDMMKRDAAYHNGTVWPWLIGAYAEAVLRVGGFSAESKAEAQRAIEHLIAAMAGAASGVTGGGCVGQIAEIYDADEPRTPQGCIAQAWSIAEPLRIAGMLA